MKYILIITFGLIAILSLAYGGVQRAEAERQKLLLEQQHQIIKDLSIDLKNCEAREEVLIDITGSSIL